MEYPLANVSAKAKIDPSVRIDPFATVADDVVIGAGSHIMANAVILDGARLGKNVVVHPGAVIAGVPQDLKFRGEKTTAEIGDNCVIRECVTVSRGTASKGKTVIGSNNLIMAYCHIAHDCVLGSHIIISNASQIAGEVIIDDYAVIGGGSLVHQFTRLGAHVMIQGGSRVGKDVPPYITAGREPLSYSGINSIGLSRRGFTKEQINRIQDIYRILYMSDLNVSKAIERIENEVPDSPERELILNFVRTSQRGIIKGYLG